MSPGGLVFENQFITVHPHTYARMIGFMVISTKRHVATESELNDQEKLYIDLAINIAAEGFKKLGYADEVVIYKKEDEGHLQYWVVGKYAPVLEKEFDISIFDSEYSMSKNGLKYATGGEIMFMTVRFKGFFSKNFKEPALKVCEEN